LAGDLLLTAGATLNKTTSMREGVLEIVKASSGEILARDVAYGKKDTVYSYVHYSKTKGRVYVGGTYGKIPFLAVYNVRVSSTNNTGNNTGTTSSENTVGESATFPVLPLVSLILAIILIGLGAYYLRRTPSHQ
jgi:hypothetical protein